jgi:NADH dehydrogenase
MNGRPLAPISTVAVTGATGFVGRAIVTELLSRGYNVRALIRDTSKAREVLPSNAKLTFVVGDATSQQSASELVAGCQAAINLVGIIRELRRLGQTFQRMHTDATRVLVQACEHSNVRRYVQMSALGVRSDGVCEYQRTKWEAETAVRQSNLDWTIMRPSLIHGRDSEFVKMAKLWMTGEKPPFVFMPYFTGGDDDTRVPLGGTNARDPRVAPVAVEDVAQAFVSCMTNPKTLGETYHLCGSELMTWPQMLRFMRDNTPGALPLQPFGVPSEPHVWIANVANFVGLGNFLPFDAGMAKMGAEDSVADMTKSNEDLGIAWKPFSKSYPKYAPEIVGA